MREHVFVSELRDRIASLVATGLSDAEIARRLSCARNTVRYHRTRVLADAPVRGVLRLVEPQTSAVRHVRTRDAVAELLARGLSRSEVAKHLGLTRQTVTYHAKRLGQAIDERGRRRYDWDAVQAFYDAGHSVRECRERFGFSSQSWHAAVKRGAIAARPAGMPIDELCVAGVERSRYHLKRRLLRAGIKRNACEICGIGAWRGAPLTLALHHANGDTRDNRVENLELLCPNCHSQTENFAGRRSGAAT